MQLISDPPREFTTLVAPSENLLVMPGDIMLTLSHPNKHQGMALIIRVANANPEYFDEDSYQTLNFHADPYLVIFPTNVKELWYLFLTVHPSILRRI